MLRKKNWLVSVYTQCKQKTGKSNDRVLFVKLLPKFMTHSMVNTNLSWADIFLSYSMLINNLDKKQNPSLYMNAFTAKEQNRPKGRKMQLSSISEGSLTKVTS